MGRATPLLFVADPTIIGEVPEPAVEVTALRGIIDPPDTVADPDT